MTPPAMTFAPDVELPRSLQPDLDTVTPKRSSNQKGARWLLVLGGVAALLVVALTFSPGVFKKGSPLRPALSPLPSTAVRAVTQPNGASLPAAVVAAEGSAAALAVPTIVAPAGAPLAPPAAKPSSVPSASSPVVADAKGDAAGDDTLPDYVSKPTLILVTDVAIRRAQRCHPQGHATGTARLFITFAQSGRVSDVRIEGEPVASAPVAGCILGRSRAIRIAKFEGARFTYVKSITMH